MARNPGDPRYSPDGLWWWDGVAWRPVAARAPAPRPPGLPGGAIAALIAGGAILVLLTVTVLGFIAYSRTRDLLSTGPRSFTAINRIPCDQLEHTQVHYHAMLQILDQGSPVAIPTDVGRTTYCYYWLHMHTGEPGMIHVEAPSDSAFTLGDFFRVWSAWGGVPEVVDSAQVGTTRLDGHQHLAVYVDSGGGPHSYTGDPARIVLVAHEVITLEIAPPTVDPPPAFDWPSGF